MNAEPQRSCLREQLAPLLNAAPGASAVAVVAIRGTDQALLCTGHEHHRGTPATPSTRFEIGSVGKTFTAMLLAELVSAGEVSFDDPIEMYLPPAARPAGTRGNPITLRQLATHTAGLPRLPPGLLHRALPRLLTNPYARFTEQHLQRAAGRTRVRAGRRGQVHYSNFGYGLLGHLLSNATRTDYPTLLATRILSPLGLEHTNCDPTQPQAIGYRHRRPRPPWRIPGMPAAGALRSTAVDLQRYLHAQLNPSTTPLSAALWEAQQPQAADAGTDRMALAWSIRSYTTHDLLFHSGATRGFTTFIGFSPQAHTGLAALANSTPTIRSHFIQDAYTALKNRVAELG